MTKKRLHWSAKGAIKSLARSIGVGVVRRETLDKLRLLEHSQRDIQFLQALYPTTATPESLVNLHKSLLHISKSRSQYRQDIFALSHLGFKSSGFFVEFGATNGIDLSNTYLLEKEFRWTGILAEPARVWHEDLHKNRTAAIETRCVWRGSGTKLVFNEVDHAGLSTIDGYTDVDLHRESRSGRLQYTVDTISLLDMLDKYQAPRLIDFLSIDTEGSEYEILRDFDFSRYHFRVITCEHNYTPMREKIYELLTRNGYTRVFTEISFNDDWYISL